MTPPSWIEEQRVTRAFWRIQIFHDPQKAAAASLLNWPEEDIEELSSGPLKLYGNFGFVLQLHGREPHSEF